MVIRNAWGLDRVIRGATRGAPKAAVATRAAVFPGTEWDRIQDPASVGYCADRLALVTGRAKELSTTAMMAVVDGRSLYEYGDLTTVSNSGFSK